MFGIILVIVFIGGIIYLVNLSSKPSEKLLNSIPVKEIEKLLDQNIEFYQQISSPEKKEIFKNRIIHFIQDVKFTTVGNAKHTLLDEVMIASSAIIPLFAFPDWEYKNIHEIILYDDHFDTNYKVDENKHIMGMVGDGAMNDTMLLSLRALRAGFTSEDGSQTALHEFVHLIDKADGTTDGVPEYLIPKELVTPWLKHIRSTIQEIKKEGNDINPYASTNEAEFFAVISEYFFEKPENLKLHHPELFEMLNDMFGKGGKS